MTIFAKIIGRWANWFHGEVRAVNTTRTFAMRDQDRGTKGPRPIMMGGKWKKKRPAACSDTGILKQK